MEKIALLNDTSSSSNWGCKATTWGLRKFISEKKTKSEIDSITLPPLPFAKLKIFRTYYENKLIDAVFAGDVDKIKSSLKLLNYQECESLEKYNTVVLNGEGSIHKKSGHVVRFLSILYLMKKLGKKCYSINQSIDFNSEDRLGAFVKKIYTEIDFVAVREPRSKQALDELGVKSALVPDFAFLNDENYQLIHYQEEQGDYVCVTGSSSLKRNSFVEINNLMSGLRSRLDLKIIFLASTKTDMALAEYAKKKYSALEIIGPTTNYLEVMNIIKKSQMLIGGRFHPTIFSMIVGTPFVPLLGNTHKMQGLMEMTETSVPVCRWDDKESFCSALDYVQENTKQINMTLAEFMKSVAVIYRDVKLP